MIQEEGEATTGMLRRSERRTAVGKDDLKRFLENLRREIEEGARPFRELRTLVDLGMKG